MSTRSVIEGGESITSLVIWEVCVDISLHTIGRFLYGPEYQAPINTGEMDYWIEDMRNITKRMLGLKDKMVLFRLIVERIASNCQNTVWVVRGPVVVSQKLRRIT